MRDYISKWGPIFLNMENGYKWKVMVIIAICLAPAGCGQEEIVAGHLEKIPGTDRIAGTSGSVFVSPDEKYLVYLTKNFSTGSLTGIKSVDLQTGQNVKHSLNRIPKDALPGGGRRLLEKANASRGYDAGWLDGKLYLPVVGTAFSIGLVIVGSDSDVGFEEIPSGVKMLADGPEWGAWGRELKRGFRLLCG